MRYLNTYGVVKKDRNKLLIISAAIIYALTLILTISVGTNAAKPAGVRCATIQGGTILDSANNPVSIGYDTWGYNYQARLFNGFYDNYSRPATSVEDGDSLMMKWNDAWLSNQDCDGDGKLDRHYGFPSFIGSGAWLTNHMSGTYDTWNVLGDWRFDYIYNGSVYPHDVHVTSFDDTNGAFEAYGIGLNDSNTWTASGTVIGANFTMRVDYDSSSYYVDVVGTIEPSGTMSGTWSNLSQAGTWSSTSGSAVEVEQSWNYFVKIVAAPGDAYKDDGIWYSADGVEIGPDIWGEFAIIQEVYNDTGTGDHGLLYKSELRSGLGNW